MGIGSVLIIIIHTSLASCRIFVPHTSAASSLSETLRPRQIPTTSGPLSTKYITVTTALDPFGTQAFSSVATGSQYSGPITTITITADSPFERNSDCSYASLAIESCNSITPGFMTMPWYSQELCLCWNTTIPTWTGYGFNEAIHSCEAYLSMTDTRLYSELRSWEGFCKQPAIITTGSSSSRQTAPPTSQTASPTQSNPSEIGVTDKTKHQRVGIIAGVTISAAFFLGVSTLCMILSIRSRRVSSGNVKDSSLVSAIPSTVPDSDPTSLIEKIIPVTPGKLDTPLQNGITP